jgi:hypothetical protein
MSFAPAYNDLRRTFDHPVLASTDDYKFFLSLPHRIYALYEPCVNRIKLIVGSVTEEAKVRDFNLRMEGYLNPSMH